MAVKRHVLLLAHAGRPTAVAAAAQLVQGLRTTGIEPIVWEEGLGEDLPTALTPDDVPVTFVTDPDAPAKSELVVVLGGDGTILRAAELVRGTRTPVLGINLGHVGFLAEAEREEIDNAVTRIAARDYVVEQRMTLDVSVSGPNGTQIHRDWALNEATVEKLERGRMIGVTIAVDGRAMSSFGCDGVVLATPTGSTAHAFSAGGPIVWPDVEAILCVPLSAHALFARPLVIGPHSSVAAQLDTTSQDRAILWCDGRRSFDLQPGTLVEVARGTEPVRLARLAKAPFSDRLVRKFTLPVRSWRDRIGG